MTLPKPAATGYFTARRVGAGNVPTLILSASDGGAPLWTMPLDPTTTFDEVRDALALFLDVTVERNVTPAIDARVYQASEQVPLDFSLAEAVYAGVEKANAPLVDWPQIAERIDRIEFELHRLRYLIELYRTQNGLA